MDGMLLPLPLLLGWVYSHIYSIGALLQEEVEILQPIVEVLAEFDK